MASWAELSGRRVLVAGASSGIGRAVARLLSHHGAHLTLVARTPGPLETLARELGASAVPGDASDAAFVESLRQQVEAEGPVEILVNSTGAFDIAPIAGTEPEMFDAMIAGNLVAPFLLMRAFLPAMLEARRGHIVTIGSVAGRVAFAGNGAYSAAKFGVRGLHAVLEQELRASGVRCTLVEPAATDTPIWDPLDPDRRDDLPGRADMLAAEAVADAVHFAITRPPAVQVTAIPVQRS